jgi:hypothetical protein
MTPTQLIRQDTAKQFKKIRAIMKALGMTQKIKKPLTEAQKVRQEGRD